jgi:hypothetical protein
VKIFCFNQHCCIFVEKILFKPVAFGGAEIKKKDKTNVSGLETCNLKIDFKKKLNQKNRINSI